MHTYRLDPNDAYTTDPAATYLGFLRAHLDGDRSSIQFFETRVDPEYLMRGLAAAVRRVVDWSDDPSAVLRLAAIICPWANKSRALLATDLIRQFEVFTAERAAGFRTQDPAIHHVPSCQAASRHLHRAMREAGVAVLAAHLLLTNAVTEPGDLHRSHYADLAARLHTQVIVDLARRRPTT